MAGLKKLSPLFAKAVIKELKAQESVSPKTVDSMWDASRLREAIEELQKLRAATERDLADTGGEHLGIMRDFIQRKCLDGERVTWGSHDFVHFRGGVTVSDLEHLACRIAAGVLRDCFSAFTPELIAKLMEDAPNTSVDFWWDFENESVIVESSDKAFPVLHTWKLKESDKRELDETAKNVLDDGRTHDYDAAQYIVKADALIAKFKSGELDYRKYSPVVE